MEVDIAVVGIGIRPNVELAEAAGIAVKNGIAVGDDCQSSVPGIFAAGDCASFPHQSARIRLESVGNAIDQAQTVAANICGGDERYQVKPWFWSDQYDTKLQIAGLSTGMDAVYVRQSDDGSLSHWYYREDQLIAVDALNDPRAYMVGKRLIEAGKSPAPADVSNAQVSLKSLLA